LLDIFARIDTFVFDIDGVLTDGTLIVMPGGEMVRRMNIKDGYALQLAVKQGFRVAIISGGISAPVKDRLEKLGIKDVFMGVIDKKATLLKYLADHGANPSNALYMGDDMPDIEAMQLCGMPCCPADACPEVRAISGRDVIEKVMKLHGKWQTVEGASSR
jgi:3-deoxy-D-manno-octulosonate 8-phosphate phosphatase (KDO 8-P phosphatase)